jgi:molybdopterin-binding protein
MTQVDIQCDRQRVVSLMSTEAAHELGLEPGTVAVAVIKSTNVIVEASAPGDRLACPDLDTSGRGR